MEAGLVIEDCFKQDGKGGDVGGGTDFFFVSRLNFV